MTPFCFMIGQGLSVRPHKPLRLHANDEIMLLIKRVWLK
jgi:hypothetical protein